LGAVALVLCLALGRWGSEAPTPTLAEREVLRLHAAITDCIDKARATAITAAEADELAANPLAVHPYFGVDESLLLTSPGDPIAKAASGHPWWARRFLRWMAEAGVGPGDLVAIASSASFPALHFAARAAAETLGARVRCVISLGASNHGATLPGFDLWAMESAVTSAGLLQPAVLLVTPGGTEDRFLHAEPEAIAHVRNRLAAIESSGAVPVLWPEDRAASLGARLDALLAEPPPALLINIGGQSANVGWGMSSLAVPRGLSMPGVYTPAPGPSALVQEAARRGIPILHLLDLRGIAASDGIVLESLVAPAGAMTMPGREAPAAARAVALFAAVALLLALCLMSHHSGKEIIP
jgi:poly-gamma-glutamate system protein